jgi:hypothetical protein
MILLAAQSRVHYIFSVVVGKSSDLAKVLDEVAETPNEFQTPMVEPIGYTEYVISLRPALR